MFSRFFIDRPIFAAVLAIDPRERHTFEQLELDPLVLARAHKLGDQRVLGNRDLALRPGQFVRVRLAGAQRRDAIAVPQTAVLEGPQGKFVYVPGKDKDGKDVAQPKPVTLGDWVEADGVNLWIVESGLAAGDALIVDGLARLQPGAPIALGPSPGAAPPGGAKDGAKPAAPAKS